MKRALLILVISLVGAGAGAGAGMFLKPSAPENAETGDETKGGEQGAGQAQDSVDGDVAASVRDDEVARALEAADAAGDLDAAGDATTRDFVRLEKQFVVPVLGEDRVASLVVLSIALEVEEGGSDAVFATEPKLRDAFLGVLFTHAQSRGFDGGFTRKDRLADLRRALTVAARDVLGDVAHGVLLTNIVRQDI